MKDFFFFKRPPNELQLPPAVDSFVYELFACSKANRRANLLLYVELRGDGGRHTIRCAVDLT